MGIFWTPAPLALVLHSHLPSVSSFWPRNIIGFPEHVGPEAAKPVTNKGIPFISGNRGKCPQWGVRAKRGDWNNWCLFFGRSHVGEETPVQTREYTSSLQWISSSTWVTHRIYLINLKRSFRQSEETIHVNFFLVVFSLTPNNHWLLIATGGKTHCMLCSQGWSQHQGIKTHWTHLIEMSTMQKPTWNYSFFGSREFHQIPNLNNISSFIMISTTNLRPFASSQSWRWWGFISPIPSNHFESSHFKCHLDIFLNRTFLPISDCCEMLWNLNFFYILPMHLDDHHSSFIGRNQKYRPPKEVMDTNGNGIQYTCRNQSYEHLWSAMQLPATSNMAVAVAIPLYGFPTTQPLWRLLDA